MPKIFLSYRRQDSAYATRSIYDKLKSHYDRDSLVFDVDTIPKGFDFVEYLNDQVSACDILLAVIGERWMSRKWWGGRRIDDPGDFVRIEIEAALKRDIPVIPVLVNSASMPTASQLPEGLRPLSRRNASEVRPGRDIEQDLERLVLDLEGSLQHAARLADRKKSRAGDEAENEERSALAETKESPAADVVADVESVEPTKSSRRGWWIAVAAIAVVSFGVIGFLLAPHLMNGPTINDEDAHESGSSVSTVGEQQTPVPPDPPELEGFIWIKPGKFTMGSSEDEVNRDDDETLHEVTLTKGFYLGKFEVTQDEYEQVMTNAAAKASEVFENPSRFTGPRSPVESVSWYDAIAYCNERSKQEGIPPYYRVIQGKGESEQPEVSILGGDGYRLPTEAEWEYACRASSKTAYGFGDDETQLGDYAWYRKNSNSSTHQVGGKKPNTWGLYDMHGNVYEWCWDWYGALEPQPSTDPIGQPEGTSRVLRGGSFVSDDPQYLRSANRGRTTPDDRLDLMGFRLSRTP